MPREFEQENTALFLPSAHFHCQCLQCRWPQLSQATKDSCLSAMANVMLSTRSAVPERVVNVFTLTSPPSHLSHGEDEGGVRRVKTDWKGASLLP